MEYQVEQVISELSKIDSASESILTSADKEKEDYAKQMRANTEKDLQKLDDAFKTNHTKMAGDIFAELIKEWFDE